MKNKSPRQAKVPAPSPPLTVLSSKVKGSCGHKSWLTNVEALIFLIYVTYIIFFPLGTLWKEIIKYTKQDQGSKAWKTCGFTSCPSEVIYWPIHMFTEIPLKSWCQYTNKHYILSQMHRLRRTGKGQAVNKLPASPEKGFHSTGQSPFLLNHSIQVLNKPHALLFMYWK